MLPDEQHRRATLHSARLLDTPPDGSLDRMARLAAAVFEAPIVLIALVGADRQWFKARVGLDIVEIPREQSFCAHMANVPGPLVVPDTRADPRFRDNPLVVGAPHIRFFAALPLRTQSGLDIGSFCVIDSVPRAGLSAQELDCLTDFAELAMTRLETIRSVGYIQQLTGLPNHNRLAEHIEKIISEFDERSKTQVLVAFDIIPAQHYHDVVKAVGHLRAENLIVEAKNRLAAALPAGTTLYHTATARFAALLDQGAVSAPSALLDTIVRAFDSALECDGVPINPNTSIGIIPVNAGSDGAQLLRALVSTVDDARERGLKWDFYDPRTDQAQQRAFSLLAALHHALQADDQLSLHYQPRIDFRSGDLVGVEALLRWQHPEMGYISPAEFVPLAEKTALIGDLTDWVIRHALRQAKLWHSQGHRFKVSINVSAHDIERGDFAATLSALLAEHGLDPCTIEVEFTENALIRNQAQVHEQLSRLRQLGIDVAIDDFGTGYCNMSYLKSIPASVVKIDQSFVRKLSTDSTDRTIVRSMIDLARSLGHKVVAEGIETQDAYDVLSAWNCDEGQGYLIAHPMEPAALMAWVGLRSSAAGAKSTNLFQM